MMANFGQHMNNWQVKLHFKVINLATAKLNQWNK